MAVMAFGSFRKYNNPGVMLYVADRVVKDVSWPFKEAEPVIISIDVVHHRVEQRKAEKAEWYELIPWREYQDAYGKLPQEIKDKIPQSIPVKGRFKSYNNPGAMLYIPDGLYRDERWPVEAGEIVKITIENGRVVERRARWFELLDWEGNPEMYAQLRPETKEEMKQSGIQSPYI